MAALKADHPGYTLCAVVLLDRLISLTELYVKPWSKTGFKYTREWNKSCQSNKIFFPSSTEVGKVENSIVKGSQIDFVWHHQLSKSMLYTFKEVGKCPSVYP